MDKSKLIALALASLFALFCHHVLIPKIRERMAQAVPPRCSITALTLDSVLTTLEPCNGDTTMVLVFNTECGICRSELELLTDTAYRHYNLVLLSHQSIATLHSVVAEFGLFDHPNIELLKISDIHTQEPYRSWPAPSMAVFDTRGRMVLKRKGFTDPKLMIRKSK